MMEVFFNSHDRDLDDTQDWAPGGPDDLEKAYAQFGAPPLILHAGDGSRILCLQNIHETKKTIVRFVTHEAFDKPLLGKFYNAPLSNQEAIQRFRNEADILTMFRGKDVPYFRELGEHEGRPYILMDVIPGISLQAISDAAEGRPLPLKAVKYIGAGIASTLATIHEAGVVHRDIKPGNVILRDDGGVSIIDFGLASRRRGEELRLTQEGQTMGTPRYLGPESFLASSYRANPKVDIYGLGLTLAEIAMGRHPMSDDQIYALNSGGIAPIDYGAKCVKAVQKIALRDKHLGSLLERMLDIDLEKRPTAAQIVEVLTGMLLERYRAQSPKHRSLSWKMPASTGTRSMLSVFGETKEAAAHAMVEAMQRVSNGSTRRRFIATAGAVGLVAAIGGAGATVLWNLLSKKDVNEHTKEDQRISFNPFNRIGKRPEEGVEVRTLDGQSCVWVFRLSQQELEALGIRVDVQNAIPCTLFYRGHTSFLFVPGKGIHPLGGATEADITRMLRTLPILDGPITIPPGFPGNEASWRSTVNGRLRALQSEIREPLKK